MAFFVCLLSLFHLTWNLFSIILAMQSFRHRRTILRYLKQKCASPTEPLWGDAWLPPRVCEAWACCFSGLASCLAPKVLGACLRTWIRNLRGWEAGHGKPDLAEKSCSKISKEFQRLLRSESLSKVSWRLLFRPIG
jgi:hypothetical protein